MYIFSKKNIYIKSTIYLLFDTPKTSYFIFDALQYAENLTSCPVGPVFQLANTNKIKRYNLMLNNSNESRKPVVVYCVRIYICL